LLKHFRQGAALCLALLLSFALSGTSHAQQRGVKKTQLIEESVTGRYLALLIGNTDYQHWPKLKTAVRDAKRMRDVLVHRYTFTKENVLLLKNATRVEMLKGLDWLKKRSKSRDRVLVYYAGHGEYDEREDGYWVPVDGARENRYQHLSNSDLLTQFGAIKARHKLLVSDSCFSGNLLTRGVVPRPARGWEDDSFFREKNKLRAVLGLASGGNEPVSDGGAKWEGNSIFAYHLLAQLEANERPFLGAAELANRITRLVANDTVASTGQPQTPVFQPISAQRHQGGEFFFIRTPARPLRALIAYLPSTKAGFSRVQESARRLVEARLLDQAPKSREDRIETAQVPNLKQLRSELQKRGLDRAVLWTLEGRREPVASLLWQGMTHLDLGMAAYELRGNKLVMIDQFLLTGERLPYRSLPDGAAEESAGYAAVAEKISTHWEENGAGHFAIKILE